MSDRERERQPRGYVASRFDEITFAVFTVLLIVTVGAVLYFGAARALDRIGCGINDRMNDLMPNPQPCHATRASPGR